MKYHILCAFVVHTVKTDIGRNDQKKLVYLRIHMDGTGNILRDT